jgi:hypothetical protein
MSNELKKPRVIDLFGEINNQSTLQLKSIVQNPIDYFSRRMEITMMSAISEQKQNVRQVSHDENHIGIVCSQT